ncbi:MAG TPA: ABC transporter ATP-binding protein [Candidatus Limnocylindrales bacterium]
MRELRSGYRRADVLQGVDLDLERGKALALLGRNGAGKTTLVTTIMGLIRPTAGRILLDGKDFAGARPDRIARAGVALVPQGRRVWPRLTVDEHLGLVDRYGSRTGGPRKWSTDKLLEMLPQLAARRGHRAGQLSGGEQQMLALARALLTDPSLVLLDEPSDGLAPAIVDRVGELVRAMLAEGVAVLLVEQDLHLAFSVADEIAIMAKGLVVHRCSTGEFRRDPGTAHRLLGVAKEA